MNYTRSKKINAIIISFTLMSVCFVSSCSRSYDEDLKIVFDKQVSGGHTEIFTMNQDGTGLKRLTNTDIAVLNSYVSWSADASSIVFARSNTPYNEIWIMDYNGENQQRLTSGFNDSSPTFSSDGEYISFTRGTVGACVVKRDGSGLVVHGSATDQALTWLPDDQKFIYTTSALNIYSANPDGSNNQAILTAAGEVRDPSWSPLNDRIAFIRENGFSYMDLWVMDTAGGNQTRLIEVTGFPLDNCLKPSWSPDGKRIVVTIEGIGIYIINSDGTDLRQILPGILGYSGFQGKPR